VILLDPWISPTTPYCRLSRTDFSQLLLLRIFANKRRFVSFGVLRKITTLCGKRRCLWSLFTFDFWTHNDREGQEIQNLPACCKECARWFRPNSKGFRRPFRARTVLAQREPHTLAASCCKQSHHTLCLHTQPRMIQEEEATPCVCACFYPDHNRMPSQQNLYALHHRKTHRHPRQQSKNQHDLILRSTWGCAAASTRSLRDYRASPGRETRRRSGSMSFSTCLRKKHGLKRSATLSQISTSPSLFLTLQGRYGTPWDV